MKKRSTHLSILFGASTLISLAVVHLGPAAAGPTLDGIIASEKIRLGHRTDTPPFAYVKDNRAQGFSVELCSLLMGAVFSVSDIEGITGVFVPVSAEERFDKLRSGEIDVLCGATTATLDRRETMSFTIPIFTTGISAAIGETASRPLRDLFSNSGPMRLRLEDRAKAIAGARIGVRAGTTAEAWLRSVSASSDGLFELSLIPDHAIGAAAVRDGLLDVYVADQAILREQFNRLGAASGVRIYSQTYTHEPYALAIPRGDEDMRLMLDRALSYLYRNGKVLDIYKKYFGAADAKVVNFYAETELPQ